MAGPVITWDYHFSPNGQKNRNHLKICGIKFQTCEQPLMMPRPILADLGITYRRIPIVSFGKDFYCDSSLAVKAVQSIFKDKALPTTPADKAYESLGYRLFLMALPIVPVDFLNDEFIKDRETLFPILARPDFASLRPGALGEWKALFNTFENEFIGSDGPWIGGKQCTIADINTVWAIKWVIEFLKLGEEPGFDKASFPRVHKWIESVPSFDDTPEAEKLSGNQAKNVVLSSNYVAPDIGVDAHDPSGFKKGDTISVEPSDLAIPGKNPQTGKLVGLNIDEAVLELDNSIRVHFPRIGYFFKKA